MSETNAALTAAMDAVTENSLLGGRIRLRQGVDGYRAGMDAALLAAACPARPGERVLEAGCGSGAVLLQIAARRPGVALAGVERDPDAVALARVNIALNGFDERIDVHQADVGEGFAHQALAPFDWAVSNPPYFDDPAAMRAPTPAKRAAWIADGGLGDWTRFLLKSVREGGRIVVIHRADRLADLLGLLGESAGSFAVRGVQPYVDAPAKRVLVMAIKTGRAPLRLLPPLVLHDRSASKHTPQAEAILRGEADLAF